MNRNVSDVISALDEAHAVAYGIPVDRDVDDVDAHISMWEDVVSLCEAVRSSAHKHQMELRRGPRTERQMINAIVKAIEEPKDKKPMKQRKMDDLPGGARMAAMRRADGKCEACAVEKYLSIHHIIPRAAGGSDEPENLIVLCNDCHDEVEEQTDRLVSRHAVLQWGRLREKKRERERVKSESEDATMDEKRRASMAKAAETRMETAKREREEAQEISEWAEQWQAFGASVAVWHLGDPEIKRPEKHWHVLAYGGGKAALESLRRRGS